MARVLRLIAVIALLLAGVGLAMSSCGECPHPCAQGYVCVGCGGDDYQCVPQEVGECICERMAETVSILTCGGITRCSADAPLYCCNNEFCGGTSGYICHRCGGEAYCSHRNDGCCAGQRCPSGQRCFTCGNTEMCIEGAAPTCCYGAICNDTCLDCGARSYCVASSTVACCGDQPCP